MFASASSVTRSGAAPEQRIRASWNTYPAPTEDETRASRPATQKENNMNKPKEGPYILKNEIESPNAIAAQRETNESEED